MQTLLYSYILEGSLYWQVTRMLRILSVILKFQTPQVKKYWT
jgi:hypothetical protein